MIKKNIRTLFALGAASINFIITDVNANWHEVSEQQAEVNQYLQVKKGVQLPSFDYFYCDKNPNATSADFHDERSYNVASVKYLSLPGSPDHIVHQFGKQLLVIPGNNYQSRMVCSTESTKQKIFRTVVMPGSRILERENAEEATNLFSRILRLFDLKREDELERTLKRQLWVELAQTTGDLLAGDGNDKSVMDGSGGHILPHDINWKGLFPGGGHGGRDDDDSDDDAPCPDEYKPFKTLLVPLKTGGEFLGDFGGIWLPKVKPEPKKKKRTLKKLNMVVVPSGDNSDSSSATIEITSNPVLENLSIIQLALIVGGFEINGDLQEQLLHLDELSITELEQLAEGFSTTIINLDSLIENNAIQTPGLSNQQLAEILLKIETLIRELAGIIEAQSDPDISRDLWRIRANLRDLMGSRLAATLLGASEVSVSGGASQHEVLVRALLEVDTENLPESDEVDVEELQELVDEYIRRVHQGLSGEDLIRALAEKIEAIQRQIDRREANLGSAQGSWLRALKNRLDTLRVELAEAEEKLDNVIQHYFNIDLLFTDHEVGGDIPHSDPEDKGGKGNGKTTGNPPSGGATPNGGTPGQGASNPPPSEQTPPEENDSDESGDSNNPGGGATAGTDWDSTKNKRDAAVWFANLLRRYSLESLDRLGSYSQATRALLLDLEKQPEKASEIKKRVRGIFNQSYSYHLEQLPADDTGEKLDPYILAMLKVMRGVALANILFDVAEEKELKAIGEMYNQFVTGERKRSVRKKTEILFRGFSGEWEVNVKHNGDDWSYDQSTGMPVVAGRLELLQLSQLIRPGSDGLIHITPEDQASFADAFLNHSDAARTPVRFRFLRLTGTPNSERIFVNREYDLHQFEDLRQYLPTRFPTEMMVGGRVNPLAQYNSALIQASQRGGIQDSIHLIMNDNPHAAALLYWLFSPNNSVIPLANMMFGGVNESHEEVAGVLQGHGMPDFSPRSSDQTDLSSQNCVVSVYSNGRMRVHYTVGYDQISRKTGSGVAVNYGAEFILELILDFDISNPAGVQLLNKQFSYTGSISEGEQKRLEKDILDEEIAEDQKTITELKKHAESLKKQLDKYRSFSIDGDDLETQAIQDWRNHATLELKFAFMEYYKLLSKIRHRNLAQYPKFAKAKAELDKAMNRLDVEKDIFNLVRSFPVDEHRTFDELSQCCGNELLEHEEVASLLEEHRKKVQDALEELQNIENEYRAYGNRQIRLPILANYLSRVEKLHTQLEELNHEYNDRRGDIQKQLSLVRKANDETMLPVLFNPVNTLVSAGLLHAEYLLTTIDARKISAKNAIEAITASVVPDRKGKHVPDKKKNRRAVSSIDLRNVGLTTQAATSARSVTSKKNYFKNTLLGWLKLNRSPLQSAASTSTSNTGSEANLLEMAGVRKLEPSLLTDRSFHYTRQSSDLTYTGSTQQRPTHMRSAKSYTDVRGQHRLSRDETERHASSNRRSSRVDSREELFRGVYGMSPVTGEQRTLGARVETPSSSPHSSSHGLNSLDSVYSSSSRSPEMRDSIDHGRSFSDGGQSHFLQVPVFGREPQGGPAYRRHNPWHQLRDNVDILGPIYSPQVTARHDTNRQFVIPEGHEGYSNLYTGVRTGAGARSRSTVLTARDLPGFLRQEVTCAQSQYLESLQRLDDLIEIGVPNQALAEMIYDILTRDSITVSRFYMMLGIAESSDDYDHLDDWKSVQDGIRNYLHKGRTPEQLTKKLFNIFGYQLHQYISRAHNQVTGGAH